MKEDKGEGDALKLSAVARDLLRRLHLDGRPRRWEPGMDELEAVHLVFRDVFRDGTADRYALTEPRQAERRLRQDERARIEDSLARMEAMADLLNEVAELEPDSKAATGIERLDNKKLATAAITEAVKTATTSVYTAQPVERAPGILAQAIDRDIETLNRGVAMRAIYLPNSRDRQEHVRYVTEIARHGGEIRTSLYRFERMVLIDRSVAFVADHIGNQENSPALKITHPGLVELFARVYDQQWEMADPWMGEIRPVDGGITTRRSRRILRLLWEGAPLKAIATDLRVSLSTVHGDLRRLHESTGTKSLMALGEWWASPAAEEERRLAAKEHAEHR